MSFQSVLPTLRTKSVRVGWEILRISCCNVGGKNDMVTGVDVKETSSRIVQPGGANRFTAVERYGRVEPKTCEALM